MSILDGDQVPVIPFGDIASKLGGVLPEQIDISTKLGSTSGFTTIVNVVVVAHCPADGVKVYVVVAVLLKVGDQVPLMPLLERVGKDDKGSPEQMGATEVNVGVTLGFTVIVIVVVVAHCPAVGVNVYVVVDVLFKAGDQEPVIPLSEVVGKGDNGVPEQIADTGVKVGVKTGSILIDTVVKVAETQG